MINGKTAEDCEDLYMKIKDMVDEYAFLCIKRSNNENRLIDIIGEVEKDRESCKSMSDIERIDCISRIIKTIKSGWFDSRNKSDARDIKFLFEEIDLLADSLNPAYKASEFKKIIRHGKRGMKMGGLYLKKYRAFAEENYEKVDKLSSIISSKNGR